jgi:hypothetical protein
MVPDDTFRLRKCQEKNFNRENVMNPVRYPIRIRLREAGRLTYGIGRENFVIESQAQNRTEWLDNKTRGRL